MAQTSPSPSAEATFQSLPFRTNFHGTTDIQENFTRHTTRTVTEDGTELRHNRFRGRTLVGVEVPVPAGYHIALVDFAASEPPDGLAGRRSGAGQGQASGFPYPPHSSGVICADDVTRVASATHFTQWEHDRPPEPAEVAALGQWVDLAAIVHAVEDDLDG